MRFGRSWRDRIPGYHTLMSNPKILDVVESLIGPEIFSNPVYNVRPKVPRVAAGAVPWHQDKSYWPDANSNPVDHGVDLLRRRHAGERVSARAPAHPAATGARLPRRDRTGIGYTEVDEDQSASVGPVGRR